MLAKFNDQPGRESKAVPIRTESGTRQIIRLHRADRKTLCNGNINFATHRNYPLPVRGFDECTARLSHSRLHPPVESMGNEAKPVELPFVLWADHVIVLFERGRIVTAGICCDSQPLINMRNCYRDIPAVHLRPIVEPEAAAGKGEMGVAAENFNSRNQFALGGSQCGKEKDQHTNGKLPNGKPGGDCNFMDREHPAGCHQLRFKSPQVYGTSNIAVRPGVIAAQELSG